MIFCDSVHVVIGGDWPAYFCILVYHSARVCWAKMDSGGKCDGNVITRGESLIAEQVKENDSNHASVGVKSLNFLSKQPIIRDLSNIKQL